MKKAAFITGASSGIGKNITETLLAAGFHVFATARKETDLEMLRALGAEPVRLDVQNFSGVSAAMAQLSFEQFSELHLINNAGIAVAGPVEAVPLEQWQNQFNVNVLGLVKVTQEILPHIRARQRKGKIVNISSVSGLTAIPYLGPYAASKFAVEALSDSLRRELGQFGIPVVLVEPGPVQTPIWEKGLAQKSEATAGWKDSLKKLYDKEFTRFLKLVEKSANEAVPTREVSRRVLAILEAKKPRPRYVVGTLATRLQAKFLPRLPSAWIDGLIAREMKQ
jgi:NAD(P)-dependent dehydrogenase (short-subunit alcohol dehydrogenase family)